MLFRSAIGPIDRSLFVVQQDGVTTLRLSEQADRAVLGPSPTPVDGGEGNDLLVALSGADSVRGGLGDDLLAAGGPALGASAALYSRLEGNEGDDTLVALGGRVEATGGAGADLFAIADTASVRLTVTDFERGRDRFDLGEV